jgi:hypothetical protein
MPLYDLERGCMEIDGSRLYRRHLSQIVTRIDKDVFEEMKRVIDSRICSLKPSQKSQLTWTRCAALIGYTAPGNKVEANDLWSHAFSAVKCHPDECNKFVGGLIMWRLSLLTDNIWLTSKTKDKDAVHPWRGYWINNAFVPPAKTKGFSAQDLKTKFQSCSVGL